MRAITSAPAYGLLRLRVRAGGRLLGELARAEPGTALVFGVLLALGALYVGAAYGTPEGGRLLLAVQAVLLGLVHGGRKDGRFLLLAGWSPRSTYVLEYLALSAPFLLLHLLRPVPLLLLAAVALPVLLPWLPAGLLERTLRRSRSRAVWRIPLPARAFEWISGVRRQGGTLLVLYTGGAAFSGYPGAVLAAVLLVAWCVSTFHFHSEGWVMVEAFGRAPGRFLAEKVRTSLALFLAASSPLAALFLVRHPPLWGALAGVLLAASLVHAGSVLAKYALYRPGRALGTIGYLTVLALGAAVAALPVGLFLLYRLWRTAHRNLGFYVDDLH